MQVESASQVAAPGCLADYTSLDLLIPELRGQDVAGVVQELCQVMRNAERVPDLLPFYHAALVREYLVNTMVGPGIAFPHARIHGLSQTCFGVGRSSKPIRWGSNECASVRLVFLSAVPATDAADYLCLLSGLTRLSSRPELVGQLHQASSAKEMLAVLQLVKLREGLAPAT